MRCFFIFLIITLNTSIAQSQANDNKLLDSIFRAIQSINNRFEKTDLEIKNLQDQRIKDSQLIVKINQEKFELSTKINQLENQKREIEVAKNILLNRFNDDSVAKAILADKQIEILLNEKYDKPGNLVLSRSLIATILHFAKNASAKKIVQLNDYLDIYDSIAEIKKLFESPYDAEQTKQAKIRITQLDQVVKRKFPSNASLLSEIENINKLVDRYCSNTLELYLIFKNIYPLANTNVASDVQTKSVFRKETEKAYFLVFQYNYLTKLLNRYQIDPIYREQFKDKPTFTCN